MNAIFEKNIDRLKKYFPKVYEDVVNYCPAERDRNFLTTLEKTKNGDFNIKIHNDGKNIFLHSNYNPEKEALAIVNSESIKKADTLLILGFGAGYHIEKLVEEYPKKFKLIIEPSRDIFNLVLKHKDITHILEAENIQILFIDNVDQIMSNIIAFYHLGYINELEFVPLPSYLRLFQELWHEIMVRYEKFMRLFTINVRTKLVFNNAWISNFFLNLKYLGESADLKDFRDKFQSVPAIIVSSGPSLNKNINLLKKVGNKALIVSAGSSISALQSAGIKPHIMLGIDGGPSMSQVYNNVEWNDILLVYAFNLHFASLDHHRGPKLYIKSNSEQHVDWLEGSINHVTPHISAGASCANVTFDFIKKLGCNPVIFIGQDLAYTNMRTHADGCIDNISVEEHSTKLIKTKDIYGKDIYTADIFMTMRYNFEDCIALYSKEHIFINSTEGGMPIKGTLVMPLQDALDKYCKKSINVKTRLMKLYAKSKRNNEKLNKKTIKFVKMVAKQSKKFTALSERRLKLVDKILKNVEQNNLDTVLQQRQKLFSLTSKLEKSTIFKEMIGSAWFDLLLVLKNNSEAEAEQTDELKDKLAILYNGLKKQYEVLQTRNNAVTAAAEIAEIRLINEEIKDGENSECRVS